MPADITPVMTPAQVAGRVAAIIRARPELYWQGNWWYIPFAGEDDRDCEPVPVARILEALDGEACGTTCCVAGWAAVLTAPPGAVLHDRLVKSGAEWERIDVAAARALGIPWPDGLGYNETIWLFEDGRARDQVLAELDRIAAGGDPDAR